MSLLLQQAMQYQTMNGNAVSIYDRTDFGLVSLRETQALPSVNGFAEGFLSGPRQS
jgi:hypothetical protein